MSADSIVRLNAALSGRYRIERQLGVGGMATVYLADDARNKRQVALKVLKPELAAVVGAERFLAEIRTTANLQHPHILPLHDSGEADGLLFYVMPFVEGESLRARLDREHQLPVDDAVAIAEKVASALDYAHRHGVVHRDIKPANILLHDSEPVVADFGIALALATTGGERLTETGLSLGTPHYMSPEQATGDQSVGPATDIWALGCVLYEMLVGEPPYTGSTPQAILGKIITGEPEAVTALRRSVPANVEAVIASALEKVPADRFARASDFGGALSDSRFVPEVVFDGGGRADPWRRATALVAILALTLASALVWSFMRRPHRPGVIRMVMPGIALDHRGWNEMELGRDGFVYLATHEGGQEEYRYRRWDEVQSHPIDGVSPAVAFVKISPDGRSLAQALDGALRLTPLDGGTPRTLVRDSVRGGGIRWGSDGYLYVDVIDGLLYRVDLKNPSGLEPLGVPLLAGESRLTSFVVGPEGDWGIFGALGEEATLNQFDFSTGERTRLVEGVSGHLTDTGHLLFVNPRGQLMAAVIDPRTHELRGSPLPLEPEYVAMSGPSYSTLRVGFGGTLAYWRGGREDSDFVWVGRDGRVNPVNDEWPLLDGGPGLQTVRLSPDGSRFVTRRNSDSGLDLWMFDAKHDEDPVRLTFGGGEERGGTWTADGRWVYYLAGEGAERDIWRVAANDAGEPEFVYAPTRAISQIVPNSDGSRIVIRTDVTSGSRDLFDVDVATGSVRAISADPAASERRPALAPGGDWLTYESDETGVFEVYLVPYPSGRNGKARVSRGGGEFPVWSRSGDEIFYIADGMMMAARLDTSSGARVVNREELFLVPTEVLGAALFDVAPDGRFLMRRIVVPDQVVLVQNVDSELERLLPN